MNENRTRHRSRITGMFLILAVAAAVLSGRLAYLMVFRSEYYSEKAEDLHQRERTIKAARGEISLEEARSDPQRKSLTSYIGTDPLKKIDRSVHGMTLLPGDKVLLMSDGVFGTLTEQEILRAAQGDAQVMAEYLSEPDETMSEALCELEQTGIQISYDGRIEVPGPSRLGRPQKFGVEHTTQIRTRVNQDYFRNVLLANYDSTCCLTGVSVPALLTASHIKP